MKIKSFWGTSSSVSEHCENCGLYKKCTEPFTDYYGEGELKILFVTGNPEGTRTAHSFGGKTMNSLQEYFSNYGINLVKNTWTTAAVQCATKKVTEKNIQECRYRVEEVIRRLKPKVIIPVGTTACSSVIGHMFRMPSVETLCFRKIPVHEYGAWVMPMLNPSNFNTNNQKSYFRRLVKWVIQEWKKDQKLVKVDPFKKVVVCDDYHSIVRELNKLLDDSDYIAAVDIETTGLKPQYEEHSITAIGIATRKKVIAFPYEHGEFKSSDLQLYKIQDLVAEFCEREDIHKIAHNIQFDAMWAETFFGDVNGWLACTRTNQHLLDHRTGAKGLKELSFLKWGIREYNQKAEKYIKSEGEGAKSLNRMREMPLYEQLLYVGADAYLTLKLSDAEDKDYAEIDSDKKHYPRRLFLESNRTLCTMQQNGIPVSVEFYKDKDKELTDKIDELEKELASDKNVLRFRNLYRKQFEYSKPIDVKRLLFEVMDFREDQVGKTEGGNVSLDEKALKEFDHPICHTILSLRKLLKVRDTYLSGFMKAEVNGKIHPFFNLTVARTYRSSSNAPNFQNVPKRDEYSKKITRKGIRTEKGWGIGEIDFSGVEVCTSAAYHKDPNFIHYLTEPGADMHRDNTCDLWMIPKKQVVKMLRFYTKNQWTFPQFYGDYFGSCGPQLWETCINKEKFVLTDGTPLVDHINSKGIKNMGDFVDHCQTVEDKMWNERFAVYTQWKKDVNDFYIKNGYVETFLGFRFVGLMDRKQTTNYPIQGTAFHILLWSINRIQEFIKKEKLKSYLCGQIHDSCIFQWHPEEKDFLLTTMKRICSQDVLKEFEWINVPFSIDVELSEINGNFAEMSEYTEKDGVWIKKEK